MPQLQDAVQEGLEVDETGELAMAGVLVEEPGQVAVVEEAGNYV